MFLFIRKINTVYVLLYLNIELNLEQHQSKLLSLCQIKASLDQIHEHSERNQTFGFS